MSDHQPDAEGQVLDSVRSGGLLRAGRPVLVLVSGGRDSVCLLDVAVRTAGREVVHALHVDYGLRDGSAGDARHCAELCDRLGVPLAVRSPRRPEGPGNLQAWARDQRYAAAAVLALELDADVASGHTATDQAETVLYRLAASPGRRALGGMEARDGRLIRPLLGITRQATAAYCLARGLPWRDDPSNTSPAYARNRIRRGLLESLREIHPAAEANLLRTLGELREESQALAEVVDRERTAADGDLATLRALPPALRRLVLQRMADLADAVRPMARGRRVRPHADRVHVAPPIASRTDELLALGSGGGSATLDLPDGLRAVVEYGRLRFERVGRGTTGDPPAEVELHIPGEVRFAGGRLVAALADCEELPPPDGAGDVPVPDGTLDRAALGPRVRVRPPMPGDRVRPLGLGGSRRLQDVLVDRRVPRAARATLPVVLAGEDVAWVPGVVTGERFAVGPTTGPRVRLRWLPAPGPDRLPTSDASAV